jgi:uncharacterized protein YjbJ (UPF0337 family)
MNWNTIAGNWQQVRGKVRSKWGKLTDDDVELVAGKKDQLVGVLRKRYGYEQERAEREVEDWARTVSVGGKSARA